MVPMLVITISMIVPHLKGRQKALLLLLQVLGSGIVVLMLMHYRLNFSNVTWRNPDGASPFWQWFGLDRWIPNTIATTPDYSILCLWLAAATLLSISLYPRTNLPTSDSESRD
jgi:hypothetical protein